MPNLCSLRRVVLAWLFRAWALRRWSTLIFLAVFSSNRSEAGPSLSHQDRTRAAMAVCNWHTVSSRFFPPFLPHLGEEQVTDRGQNHVAFESQVASALVLVQADLALLVFKTPFDPPAGKGHQQQGPDPGLRRRIAEEKLDLPGVQHIAGDDQVQPRPRQAFLVFHRDQRVLALPYHRSLLAVLDPPALPGLVAQGLIVQQLVEAARRSAPAGQARHLAATAPAAAVVRAGDDARRLQPAGETPGHLGDPALLPRR